MSFRFFLPGFIFVVLDFLFMGCGYAANLTVMPTTLKLSPPKVADTITIRNEGRMPVKMQMRIFRWEQEGGKDVYYPTSDVVVSPPFVTIKGGGDGNIRIARLSPKPVIGLESYRLIIDELPSSRVKKEVTSRHVVVEVVTRQILPIFFVADSLKNKASPSASMLFRSKAAKGGYNITAVNTGAGLVHLGTVILLASGQEVGRVSRTVGNILPKSEFTFFVPAKGGGKPQAIRVMSAESSKDYPLQ